MESYVLKVGTRDRVTIPKGLITALGIPLGIDAHIEITVDDAGNVTAKKHQPMCVEYNGEVYTKIRKDGKPCTGCLLVGGGEKKDEGT